MANSKVDRATAVSIEGVILKYCIMPRIAPISATTRPIIASDPRTDPDTDFTLSRISIDAAIALRSIPRAIAVVMEPSTLKPSISPRIRPKPATTPRIAYKLEDTDFEIFPTLPMITIDVAMRLSSIPIANADL